MDPLLILLVAGVVLLAELPDKSMFASLVLGSRFKPGWVFLGIASAFVVHVTIAVTAGSLLRLAPRTVVESIVAALFLAGAVYLWVTRHADEEEEGEQEVERSEPTRSPRHLALAAYGTSFLVIFVGEWGDITQILTANLAAKYHDTWSVAIGAVIGLCTASLLAITLGQTLLKYLKVSVLHTIGAVVLLGFAVYSVVTLVTG
ncbi:TMEM165/GDT1 family protein [Jatrophihabitans sp. YIM 134969]